ncbi:hypothetical protein ACFQ1S_00435 [Kibdelosporangium lantanae]|uniref:Uncharacterized protein n=1 Tax=Kibdelosporangium lantanae TaxID=1497396 RepID=A0ABW3M2R1_9PSEU
MGVRLIDTVESDNVIPLRNRYVADNGTPHTDEQLPEPATLYSLIILAFVLHTPSRFTRCCVRCSVPWPCDHLRLAYRLREGF